MSDEQKREEKKQRSGAGSFVKWTLLIVIGLPVAWFAFCEARKAYWDWRVTQMCKVDGGIVVFERAPISDERVREKLLPLPYKRDETLSTPYFIQIADEELHSGAPRVWRSDTRIIRAVDNKVLASKIEYGRTGGDPIVIDHPSYFHCPDPRSGKNLLNAVFGD